ncbi:MAG TPA: hypothetical protein DCQ94_05155 [Nitrospira sp.]|nr:hypothetical protein [Nitrospira sp.]
MPFLRRSDPNPLMRRPDCALPRAGLVAVGLLLLCAGLLPASCATQLTPEEVRTREELLEKLRPWRQERRDRLNFLSVALQDSLG